MIEMLHPPSRSSQPTHWPRVIIAGILLAGAFAMGAKAQPGFVCETPLVISALPFDGAGNTSAYGDDYDNADVPPVAASAVTNGTGSPYYISGDDVVYAYTPSGNQEITITTTNDDDWIGLWAFTGCPFASTVGYHTSISGAARAINNLPVQGGVTYYFVISTWAAPQSTDYTIHIELNWAAEPCTGLPDPGATTGPANACLGVPFTLGTENSIANSGINYQWEISTDGGNTWANALANDSSAAYTTTQTDTTMYRCIVTCEGNGTAISTPWEVGMNPPTACYCIPTGAANNLDEIRNFTLSNLDHSSPASEGTNGYTNYTDSVPAAQLFIGLPYVASLTSGSGSGSHGAAIWIDLNDNGLFEAAERVTSLTSSITGSTTASFPAFTLADSPGIHRLRVQYTHLQDGGNLDPCVITTTYSETEDYLVEVTSTGDCSGMPTVEAITTSDSSVCVAMPFSLEGSGITELGITYQWQSSPAGSGTWTDITGATSPTYTVAAGISAATDFRLMVTCTNGNESATSNTLSITMNPPLECYCIPTGSLNNGDEILNFTLGSLNNSSAASEGVNGYINYTSTVAAVQLNAGSSAIASLTSGPGSGNHGAAIWIDLNDNGAFEASEKVTFLANSITGNSTVSFPAFTVATALGTHRLRVQYTYLVGGDVLDPCVITTQFAETEDYLVEIIAALPDDCLGVAGGTALPGTPCVASTGFGGMWSNACICVENVGIEENLIANGVGVHPNPASSELFISTPNGQPVHVKVYDMVGHLVKASHLTNRLDISALAPGSYSLQVIDEMGNRLAHARFVKQ